MDKLDKAIVLYFPAAALGSKVGAHCGDCWKFVGGEGSEGKCIEVAGPINGPHGVCGLYVNGRLFDRKKPQFPEPVVQISKQVAGYVEQGPTHCGNCEYYAGRPQDSGACHKVQGIVQFFGCCNRWDGGDE